MFYTIAAWVLLIVGLYILAGGERRFADQWQDVKKRLRGHSPETDSSEENHA